MAVTSGNFTTSYDTSYNNFSLTFRWNLVSQSAENNTSTISFSVKWETGGSGDYRSVNYDYGYINGQRKDGTTGRINAGSTVASGTVTIPHNDDGTKTFSASWYTQTTTPRDLSGSGSWELPKIDTSVDMNIRLGDNIINKVYVGTVGVKEVFYGDMNIFPGYTRLQYIQSSGTQYINTGILCTDKIMMKIKFINLSVTGNTIIGNMGNPETDTFRFFNASGICYLDYGSGAPYNRINGGNINANTLYELEVGNRYVKNLVTGTNIVSSSSVSFSNKSYNIFVNGNTAYSSNKWYYVKIYSNSNLVRDFIPVKRKTDNKVGLYDLVEHKFYGNNGSGEFIAGPEV